MSFQKLSSWANAYMFFVVDCISVYGEWASSRLSALLVIAFPICLMAAIILILPAWVALSITAAVLLPCVMMLAQVFWHFLVLGAGRRSR